MGDRSELCSPLNRARLGVVQWLESLPGEYKIDAMMALDKLCQIAEQQIEQAYFDGYNHRTGSERSRDLRKALESGIPT